jgi:hypothetical protein
MHIVPAKWEVENGGLWSEARQTKHYLDPSSAKQGGHGDAHTRCLLLW